MFGQAGASDYTKQKDNDWKDQYIDRDLKNQPWSKDGIETAGLRWKHTFWNKSTLKIRLTLINKITA